MSQSGRHDLSSRQRSRELVKASEAEKLFQRFSNTQLFANQDPSLVPIPLWLGYSSVVVPKFISDVEHKIYAETPEDGYYQEWTGHKGQEANFWRLTGYQVVNIRIEYADGQGNWKNCNYKVGRKPMPNPDPTITVLGFDLSGLGAEVYVIPEFGPP